MPKKVKREMRGRREMLSIYLRPEIADKLRALSAATDTPVAHYLRQAVDELLLKHEAKIKHKRGSK